MLNTSIAKTILTGMYPNLVYQHTIYLNILKITDYDILLQANRLKSSSQFLLFDSLDSNKERSHLSLAV